MYLPRWLNDVFEFAVVPDRRACTWTLTWSTWCPGCCPCDNWTIGNLGEDFLRGPDLLREFHQVPVVRCCRSSAILPRSTSS